MKSLRAFEAAARLGGVSRAAEELCVSQGAVSQQIRNLEDYLGCELFIRKPNSFLLSEDGVEFARVVRTALVDIANAANEISRDQDGAQLMISTWQGFAAKWLMPHLGEFYAMNPGVTVAFDLSTSVVNFRNDGIDAAIRFGHGNFDGVDSVLLFQPSIRAVASPQYLKKFGKMESMLDPGNHTIIDNFYRSSEIRSQHVHWEDVIDGNIDDLSNRHLSFPDEQQSLNAAIQGQGVALVSTHMIEAELNDKKIEFAAPDAVNAKGAVYFVWPRDVRPNPALDLFRDWLAAALARY